MLFKIRSNRFQFLDSLRGIAAIAVVLHHFLFVYDREYGHTFKFTGIFEFGFYGVELFFIISGFVIFYSLTKTKSIKDFLLKRIIRLYPTYWVCLVITFTCIHFFPLVEYRNTTFFEALSGLTMFQSLFKVKPVDPSYWSLWVEWFFYFMISIFTFTLKNRNTFYFFLWGWLGLILFYNLVYKIPFMGAFFNLRYGSLFIAGICFYKLYAEKEMRMQFVVLLLSSFAVSLIALRDLDFSNFAITIIFIVFFLCAHFKFSFLESKILLFFGEISYALYLIHQNIGFIIMHELDKTGFNNPLSVVIAITVVIILATIITKKIEKPISDKLKTMLQLT